MSQYATPGTDAQAVPLQGEGQGAALAEAAEPARVSVQFATRVADLTRLADVGAGVAYMIDIASVLEEVLQEACRAVGTSTGVLWLYDAAQDRLWPAAVVGLDPAVVAGWGTLRRGEGSCGTALETLEPVVVEDVLTSPLFAGRGEQYAAQGWRAVYSVPMVTLGREVMGTIATYYAEPHVPGQRETRILEAYARQGAELVERARLHGEARQLAALERRRGLQLRALADTAMALTACDSLDDCLRTVTESARDVVGAHQAVTTRLYGGVWSNAVTHVSLSEKYAQWRDYDEVPKGLGVLNAVTEGKRPLRLTPEELVSHPAWRGLRDSPGHPPLPDYLAAPLLDRAGDVIGLLQLSDKGEEGSFTPEDEAMVVQLAQMASSAIEKVELLERERAARAEAEDSARLLRVLSDAGAALSASLELEDVVAAVTDLVVPTLADWAGVHLLDEDGRLGLVGDAVVDTPEAQRLQEVARAYPASLDQEVGPGLVTRTGRTQELPLIDDAVLEAAATPETPVEVLRVAGRHGLVVPLTAHGRTLGAISLNRSTVGPYTPAEVGLCEDLAARAALAIDNARRYAFERSVAVTLQRSLLPDRLPVPDSVEVARRYLPGAEGTRVGGDWYDVIDLGDGRLGLVVGDVMGRGVRAAAIMGQLRVALRAYALDQHEPAEVLRRLDRLVQALGDNLTTCVYGILDPASRRLTVAAAGHLPPLVVPVDAEPWLLALDPGLPLGAGGTYLGDDPSYSQTELTLPAGGTVVLYTDGLVESPDAPVDEGLSRLRAAAATAQATDPEELCDRLLEALGRAGHHDDDTALLAVRVNALPAEHPQIGQGPEWPVRLELSSAPESVAVARSAVAGLLLECGREDLVDDVCVLVSELVTNAVRHAGSHLKVCARLVDGRLRVEVVDRAEQHPSPRAAQDDDESGRGLALVEALADAWGSEPTEDGGKVVWAELVGRLPSLV